MLTVPAWSLTASRGKSLGSREYPGTNAADSEVTGAEARADGPAHGDTARTARQCHGTLATMFWMCGALWHCGVNGLKLVPMLYS